jgi:hypothetical protein
MVYPAVEESGARLRFFLHATHSSQQIISAAQTVAEELNRIHPAALDTPPAQTPALGNVV